MPYDWDGKSETGFFQEGHNERGVPVLCGTTDTPALWFAIHFLVIGAILCALAILNFYLPVTLTLLAFGLLYGANGVWLLRLRRRLAGLAPLDNLARRAGLEPTELARKAYTTGILPRYVINGRDYYDPSDFGPEMLLLRPAQSPVAPQDVLVRPAHGASADPNLLRASAEKTAPDGAEQADG